MKKILITPRSFAKTDLTLLSRIKEDGFDIVLNERGSILDVDQMKSLICDCDGLIVGVDPVDQSVIDAAPRLKAIAKYGVGTDNIDTEYCKRRGIHVSKTIGANSEAVADFTLALMLAVARKVVLIDKYCRQDNWGKIVGTDVFNKSIGIIGLGAIGKAVVRRARGFNMNIFGYDPYWNKEWADKHQVSFATLHEIYMKSDYITLHLPLLPDTKNMISFTELRMMKKSAIIINTARGELINENDLLNAIKQGEILGAGIDAFSQEPPINKEWYKLDQVVLGSHAAAASLGAAENMSRISYENLKRDILQ